MNKKLLTKIILSSVAIGSLSLVSAMFQINSNVPLPLMSIAQAKVQTYTGVGECIMSEFETQSIVQQRAASRAIRQATEQAGVYLQTYSRSINGNLSNEEISAIASNSYQVVGEVKYERIIQQVTDESTAIVWKATVKVNVDDAEVRSWLNRDAQNQANIVNQNNTAQQAAAENDRQVEDLRKRARNATTDEERARIRTEYEQADNEFLANQKFEEGNQLYYQQNYNGAIAKYNEVLQLNPNYAEAYYNRGCAYDDLDNNTAAISDYTKAIELYPNYFEAYNNRGLAYYNMGNRNAAIIDYNKAIAINPNDEIAYYNRGLAYQNIRNYNAAIADYTKAIALNPNYLAAHNNRAIVYTLSGKFEEAIKDATKTIELHPDKGKAYYLRGIIYQEMGDNMKAQADFAKARELGYNG